MHNIVQLATQTKQTPTNYIALSWLKISCYKSLSHKSPSWSRNKVYVPLQVAMYWQFASLDRNFRGLCEIIFHNDSLDEEYMVILGYLS